MIIKPKDLVIINKADEKEAIGLYGRVIAYVGKDQYHVMYRQASVLGSLNPGTVIIKYDDMSLVAQHKENRQYDLDIKQGNFKLEYLGQFYNKPVEEEQSEAEYLREYKRLEQERKKAYENDPMLYDVETQNIFLNMFTKDSGDSNESK